MKCELISISRPLISGVETAEDLVAFCARVSNPANQLNTGSSYKLLQYLIRNQHWSPFEMVSLTIGVTSTRDIIRQLLRHRSFSFQEFSQRYAAVVDFADPREVRLQDTKNRQNSIEVDDEELANWWAQAQFDLMEHSEEIYQIALDKGVAKEVARSVLPEGLTSSVVYVSGTLRSWIHYCQLRMGNGTQKEHQEIANACWEIIGTQFPSVVEAFSNGE